MDGVGVVRCGCACRDRKKRRSARVHVGVQFDNGVIPISRFQAEPNLAAVQVYVATVQVGSGETGTAVGGAIGAFAREAPSFRVVTTIVIPKSGAFRPLRI